MFKNLRKSNRLFLSLVPLAILLAGSVLFLSAREKLTGCDCGMITSTGEFDSEAQEAFFEGRQVTENVPQFLAYWGLPDDQSPMVLGVTNDERWLEIDLSDQRLYAYEGEQLVYNFLISSGKNWTPTPTGEFRIWSKFKYAKMSGGQPGTSSYYYLPNVPYIQYFHHDYGLHGAYWHNNFGQQMSHGCVNLSIPDSQQLFYWTSPVLTEGKNAARPSKDQPGTRVVIHI